MKENEEGRTQEERGVKRINEMGRAQEAVVVCNCLLIREEQHGGKNSENPLNVEC
jgi:hypothetical protein